MGKLVLFKLKFFAELEAFRVLIPSDSLSLRFRFPLKVLSPFTSSLFLEAKIAGLIF